MIVQTRVFGEVAIDESKVIHFPKGIIGFPELTDFALMHDEEQGDNVGIRWMQSLQETHFAIPVVDPLRMVPAYNPKVNDELLEPLGNWNPEDMLVLVSITVPSDLTKMSINLRAPFVINAAERKANQVIVEDEGEEYPVKYPVYDILQKAKEEAQQSLGKEVL